MKEQDREETRRRVQEIMRLATQYGWLCEENGVNLQGLQQSGTEGAVEMLRVSQGLKNACWRDLEAAVQDALDMVPPLPKRP